MIKQHVSTPRGMSKDLSSDKQSDKYFDAKNIRILSTDQKSTFAVTNEAGNQHVFTIPTPTLDTLNTSINYTVNGLDKYSDVEKGVPIHVAGTLAFNRKVVADKLTHIEQIREGSKIRFWRTFKGWYLRMERGVLIMLQASSESKTPKSLLKEDEGARVMSVLAISLS
jgi:hypothetical protein